MTEIQQWFYSHDEQTYGPVSAREVGELIQRNVIFPSSWLLAEGTEDWVLAKDSIFTDYFIDPFTERDLVEPPIENADSSSLATPIMGAQDSGHSPVPTASGGPGTVKHLVLTARSLGTTPLDKVRALVGSSPLQRGVVNATLRDPAGDAESPRQFRSRFQPRWSVIVPVLVAVFCLLALAHHFRHWRAPWNSPAREKTQSGSSSALSDLEPSKPLSDTLIVKGLYIGMDGDEATKNIVVDGQGKITVRPTTYTKAHGYDILLQANGSNVGSRHGQIWTDPKDETVTIFFFDGKLSDFLFNTADQSPKEFVKTFADSYNVPTLSPTQFSGKQGWSYSSPQGWTVRIMIDKTVDTSKTPDRNFD